MINSNRSRIITYTDFILFYLRRGWSLLRDFLDGAAAQLPFAKYFRAKTSKIVIWATLLCL